MLRKYVQFFVLLTLTAMLSCTLIVPKVAAACDPGTNNAGFKLTNCLYLDSSKETTVADVYKTPAVFVNLIVGNIFIFAGIILFFLIIYVGYLFISGGTKGSEQAKTVLETAVTGFLIMFAAYW